MLSLGRNPCEYLVIGEDIVIQVVSMEGDLRLSIDAPKNVSIVRGEVYEKYHEKPECREQSITLIKVYAKDISRQCSRCSAPGHQEKGSFCCPACGFHADIKTNAAQNAKKRGRAKAQINEGNGPALILPEGLSRSS